MVQHIIAGNPIENKYQHLRKTDNHLRAEIKISRDGLGYQFKLREIDADQGCFFISEDSAIWLCTNCYTCYERCPQDVRPIEVINVLKNITVEQKKNPVAVDKIVESVKKSGRTVMYTPLVDKRRAELGLKEIEQIPDAIKEIEIITKK